MTENCVCVCKHKDLYLYLRLNQIIAKIPNWFDSEVCSEGLCSEHVSHIVVLFGEIVEPLGNRASLGEMGHV